MRSLAEKRIAANDSSLATAAARHELAELREASDRVRRHFRNLPAISVSNVGSILKKVYGELVLAEDIIRPRGSRAKAHWIVLDAGLVDAVLVPVKISVRTSGGCTGIEIYTLRVRVGAHVVARVMQRTLQRADFRAAGLLLAWHCAEGQRLIDAGEVRAGDEVATTSPEGTLLWTARGEKLFGQTWVVRATADDPTILPACAALVSDIRHPRRAPQEINR